MPDLENNVSIRLIKTFGRLKGRALSNNQKLGMKMLQKKYNFFLENCGSLETKKKNLARSWFWEWTTPSRISKKKL